LEIFHLLVFLLRFGGCDQTGAGSPVPSSSFFVINFSQQVTCGPGKEESRIIMP